MIVLLSYLLLELMPILFYETKISSKRSKRWVGQEESSKASNFDAVDLGLLGVKPTALVKGTPICILTSY